MLNGNKQCFIGGVLLTELIGTAALLGALGGSDCNRCAFVPGDCRHRLDCRFRQVHALYMVGPALCVPGGKQ